MTEVQTANTKKTTTFKTLSLLFFIGLHLSMFVSCLLLFYSIITLNLWLIAIIAFIIVVQFFTGKSKTICDYIAKHMHPSQAFNSFTIINDCKESQTETLQNCLFTFHPHSIYCMGVLCSMNNLLDKSFYNMTSLGTTLIFFAPIFGGLSKLWGVSSASNYNIKRLMKQKKNLGLIPGGYQQATITSPNEMRFYIKNRKGFIKYALQYNYTICPVIIMGEHQAFWTFQPFVKFRLFLNKLKLPGVLWWNKKTTIALPTNLDITVIKGKPMSYVQEISDSGLSKELVDRVHSQYIQQLQRIYTKYKSLNGDKPFAIY